MRIGILASQTSWYLRDIERAAHSAGHSTSRLDFERLVAHVTSDGQRIECDGGGTTGGLETPFDAVIVRTMPPGSLEQVVYRMNALGRWQAAGIRVVNSPRSLECAVDKYLTTARLAAAGLPVPPTVACEHEDDALNAFTQLGGDVVVKPLFGSEGRGIVRVTDPDLAHRTFRTLMRLQAVLYLQQFIDHEGFDVRVLVLGGAVVGAIRRRSALDFRTNVARDAIPEPHEPTQSECDLAVAAAAVTGTDIAGIDLLYDREGRCYVIEVNAVPGWQAFSRTTGIDVAARLVDWLSRHCLPGETHRG